MQPPLRVLDSQARSANTIGEGRFNVAGETLNFQILDFVGFSSWSSGSCLQCWFWQVLLVAATSPLSLHGEENVVISGPVTAVDPLGSLMKKFQLIDDRVKSVAHRFHTGAYIVGQSGCGKTHAVREALKRSDRASVIRNARMTPGGIGKLIAENREHIIVLDDITTLFKSDRAMQVLMAATDGDPQKGRLVTYKSKDDDDKVEFTGGIIAISNLPLRNDPLARAFGSRVVVLEHEPTDEEIAAFMRHLSSKGYHEMSPAECLEVAEFVIAETRAYDQHLDLRHLHKAWQDYRQDKQGLSVCSWQELVSTSLQKVYLSDAGQPLSKREQIQQECDLVREGMRLHPNDALRQMEFCRMKKSTFYKRRAEVLAADLAR